MTGFETGGVAGISPADVVTLASAALPALRLLDPERAHALAMRALARGSRAGGARTLTIPRWQ